jgi:hypothetical protein
MRCSASRQLEIDMLTRESSLDTEFPEQMPHRVSICGALRRCTPPSFVKPVHSLFHFSPDSILRFPASIRNFHTRRSNQFKPHFSAPKHSALSSRHRRLNNHSPTSAMSAQQYHTATRHLNSILRFATFQASRHQILAADSTYFLGSNVT